MPAAPVVPKSLTKPVPASQARSQIQELLDANRARVERLSASGQRALVLQLVALEAELRQRLGQLQAAGRGGTWTAADTEAALVQVRELLGRQGAAFRALLRENAATARRLGVRNTVAVLQHFERQLGGTLRPLSLDASEIVLAPLLARHASSVERYGLHTIGLISQAMQRGMLAGDTFVDMRRRLTGDRGDHGPLVQSAGWASRIVRTEAMHAYNAGAHEEALAQRDKRFPDLQKKLIETFDSRTAADSRVAHGEVRDLEAPFVDGKGRRYLHPPGRPHDRGVEIPWRAVWAEGGEQASPAAPAPSPAATQTTAAPTPAPAPGAAPGADPGPPPAGHEATWRRVLGGSGPVEARTVGLTPLASVEGASAAQLLADARRFATPPAMAAAAARPPEAVPWAWVAVPEAAQLPRAALDAAMREAAAGRLPPPVLVSRGGRYVPADDTAALHLAAHAAVRPPSADGAVQGRVIRPPHATDPQAFAQEMGLALDAKNGLAVRSALRDVLEAQGIHSRDTARGKGKAYVYRTDPDLDANAEHGWNGHITVRESRHDLATAGFRSIASGRAADDMAPLTRSALRTLFHEEIHGASSIAPMAYRRFGIGIEEAGTELLARQTLTRFFGLTTTDPRHPYALPHYEGGSWVSANDGVASYNRYVKTLLGHTHDALGGSPAQAVERLGDAFRKLRGQKQGRPPDTPEDHLEALAEALGLEGAARRRFEAAVRRDPDMRP